MLDALSVMRTVVDMSQDGHGAHGSVYNGLCFVYVSFASIFDFLSFSLSFFLEKISRIALTSSVAGTHGLRFAQQR